MDKNMKYNYICLFDCRVKRNELKTVHLPGYRIGLTVAMDANLDDYAATTGRSNGFKVNSFRLYSYFLSSVFMSI